MDENELLILGLLQGQEQHGYQINEFLDKNLGQLTTMKRPTAYATLERLHRQGCVTVRLEQPGKRAPRKVYAITALGKERLLALLRANLQTAHLSATTEIGLMFSNHLPPAEVVALLMERLAKLTALLAMHEQAPSHFGDVGADLALAHFVAVLQAEATWLRQTLAMLADSPVAPPQPPAATL